MMSEHDEDPGSIWDTRYTESGWSEVPDVSLVSLASSLTPGRALDLGCGTGRNALWLARAGWHVTGVDASAVGLNIAHEQATREGLNFESIRADLLEFIPPAEQFDLVVVANIHFLPSQRGEFFDRAARAVAPSGYLYVVGHHVDAWGHHGPPFRDRLFDESLFQRGLPDMTTEILERRIQPSDDDDAPDAFLLLWAVKRAKSSS